jgi:hypothetical protein
MSSSGTGGVQRFDHAGVVVDDLELVTAFFAGLALELTKYHQPADPAAALSPLTRPGTGCVLSNVGWCLNCNDCAASCRSARPSSAASQGPSTSAT